MIPMIVTKITRLIITTIIIIKTIKFTNVIGYYKPQFGLYGDNVCVMLINGLSYWIVYVYVRACAVVMYFAELPVVVVVFLNKMHSFLNFGLLLINL